MKLELKRLYKKDTYTIGKLYINDEYFCDTLEDKDRNLTNDMSLADILNIKVYGRTAIPKGHYKITITYSPKFKTNLPLINDVIGYSGIRIHQGNTHNNTSGCILVGENKIKGQLINSKNALSKLLSILSNANDDITMDII
jgi:hypothetical protein